MSRDLSGAIEYYGGQEEYRYRVFVELYQDGVQVANDGDVAKKEVERLAGLGYIVAMEACSDEKGAKTYFILHATAEQVKNFDADVSIGYALWLYDEKVEGAADLNGTIHVWYGGMNGGMERNVDGKGE